VVVGDDGTIAGEGFMPPADEDKKGQIVGAAGLAPCRIECGGKSCEAAF
jgi:hypothetical protein